MIYQLVPFFGFFAVIISYLFKGKYKKSLMQKLGFKLPVFNSGGKKVIWMHAVSMGEVGVLTTLFPFVKKAYPDAKICISTVTETGLASAKQKLPDADLFFQLPIDRRSCMKKLICRLNPSLFLFFESDYWYNLLKLLKQKGTPSFLINGKLSQKSFERYSLAKRFSARLFSSITHLSVQSDEDKERFIKLGVNPNQISVQGNLKFDQETPVIEKKEHAKTLITLGSTHPGEEALLLTQLTPIDNTCVIVVPRHPERFDAVFDEIKALGLSVSRFSLDGMDVSKDVLLVDQMGLLLQMYSQSTLSIVGGSFVPGIGGHNFFEPVQMGSPVLFGPFTYSQKVITNELLKRGAGICTDPCAINQLVKMLLSDQEKYTNIKARGGQMLQEMSGNTLKTWELIVNKLSIR